MNKLERFIEWLKSEYRVEVFKNDGDCVILVYAKTTFLFNERIPEEFKDLSIEYHYADVIMKYDGGLYFPGISKYDESVEYFTLKIATE